MNELVAQIPARAGSKRVRSKNLRYLGSKPMIQYSIEAALEAGVFSRVIVNSDSNEIIRLAEELGAESYLRKPELAGDQSSGDDFTFDFINQLGVSQVAMVNPVCPLITPSTIKKAVEAFLTSSADTLISCSETQMQVAVEGNFVNINSDEPLRPTQENPKVQTLNWAVTIWDANKFRESYLSGSGAYCGSDRLLFPIPALESVKVSTEDDFRLAEALILARNLVDPGSPPSYWS